MEAKRLDAISVLLTLSPEDDGRAVGRDAFQAIQAVGLVSLCAPVPLPDRRIVALPPEVLRLIADLHPERLARRVTVDVLGDLVAHGVSGTPHPWLALCPAQTVV